MMSQEMRRTGEFLLTKIQKALSETIAELSGKPVGEVSKDLKTHSKRALLMKYKFNLNKLRKP